MTLIGRYEFKKAETPDEIEQVHRLNHRTFAEEIPQHAATADGRLVDKFHAKNQYFVARAGRVVGMLAVHGDPPFSVADRLPDTGLLARADRRPLEVRLLAVEPEERRGQVLIGLCWLAMEHAREQGFTDVYISAVFERVEMYRRIGFEPLGPPMPSGGALFVPMGVSFPLPSHVEQLAKTWSGRLRRLSAATE